MNKTTAVALVTTEDAPESQPLPLTCKFKDCNKPRADGRLLCARHAHIAERAASVVGVAVANDNTSAPRMPSQPTRKPAMLRPAPDAKLRAELLMEYQAGKLRFGAEVIATNGPQVIVTYKDVSYTLYDHDGARREAEAKKLEAARKAKEAADKAAKAEETRKRVAAYHARLYSLIKAGKLDNVAAIERNGTRITVLFLANEKEVSFDDPELVAAAEAEKDSKK